MLVELLLTLGTLQLIDADSIILKNGCRQTTEECVIELETIKGEPGRDCAIFSTENRLCSINSETDTTVQNENSEIAKISKTDSGTVVTWHGTNEVGNHSASSHLDAGSVWMSLPKSRSRRSTSGEYVTCNCKPIEAKDEKEGENAEKTKQKRSLDSITSESKMVSGKNMDVNITRLLEPEKEGCVSNYRPLDKFLQPNDSGIIRKMPADSVHNCASFCKMEFVSKKTCISFAFALEGESDDCVLLSTVPVEGKEKTNYIIYEKC